MPRLEACALKVTKTQIARFGEYTLLVVERFDRAWRDAIAPPPNVFEWGFARRPRHR